MKITHVLKDGTVIADLTGHVVRKAEAEDLYKILYRVKKRRKNND